MVTRQLPRPLIFRPRLVDGWAIVGIDILKLSQMRPTGLPQFAGFATQNAVDRVAVEWDEGGTLVHGFYVPSRYSPSTVNTLVSSARLFPTVFTQAQFYFDDRAGRYRASIIAGQNRLDLEARECDEFIEDSVFCSLQAASDFHRDAKISYSPSPNKDSYDAIYLKTLEWQASPLEITHLSYSLIDRVFPKAVFDSAMVVRNTKHEWHGLGSINLSGSWAASKEKSLLKESANRQAAQKKHESDSKEETGKETKPKRTAPPKSSASAKSNTSAKSSAKATASKKKRAAKPEMQVRSAQVNRGEAQIPRNNMQDKIIKHARDTLFGA